MPLHISIVIESFDPLAGGAERSTAQMVEHLIERGHRVTVITGSVWNRPEHDQLDFLTAPLGRPRGVVRLLAFRRWAMKHLATGGFNTSVSVTTSVPAAVVEPRAGLVAQAQARSIARRSTAGQRTLKRLLIAMSARQRALLACERRTLADPTVQRFVALSRYVADDLQRYYAFDDQRVTVIPNGSEMAPVDEETRRRYRTQVRRAFAIDNDAVVYLFPALDPWRKGLGTLLSAAKLLAQRGVNFVLVLAGSQAYDQQRMVAELGLRDQVRFIGPTRQMQALFCAADVTVLPTWHDPSSKVVLESLMMGTPAISSAFNGASDWIEADGLQRGRVVADPGDVEGLCQAMADMADAAERDRCRQATAGLDEQLTMARHVEALEQVLQACAAERDAVGPLGQGGQADTGATD